MRRRQYGYPATRTETRRDISTRGTGKTDGRRRQLFLFERSCRKQGSSRAGPTARTQTESVIDQYDGRCGVTRDVYPNQLKSGFSMARYFTSRMRHCHARGNGCERLSHAIKLRKVIAEDRWRRAGIAAFRASRPMNFPCPSFLHAYGFRLLRKLNFSTAQISRKSYQSDHRQNRFSH